MMNKRPLSIILQREYNFNAPAIGWYLFEMEALSS
jgi:hypothetical protein